MVDKAKNIGFGERFAEFRAKKGLTQQEIADLFGISQTSVQQWEAGGNIKMDRLIIISNNYSISLDWLLLGVGQMGLEKQNAQKSYIKSYNAESGVKFAGETNLEFEDLKKENEHLKEVRELNNYIKELNLQISDLNKQILELKDKLLEEKISTEKRFAIIEMDLASLKKLFREEKEFNKARKFLKRPMEDISICITDSENNLIYVNDQFTKQTGYTTSDAIGKHVGNLLQQGDSNQNAINNIRKALRSREYFEGEVVNYAKDGSKIICKLIIAPMKEMPGQIEKFISLAVFSKVNVLKYN